MAIVERSQQKYSQVFIVGAREAFIELFNEAGLSQLMKTARHLFRYSLSEAIPKIVPFSALASHRRAISSISQLNKTEYSSSLSSPNNNDKNTVAGIEATDRKGGEGRGGSGRIKRRNPSNAVLANQQLQKQKRQQKH